MNDENEIREALLSMVHQPSPTALERVQFAVGGEEPGGGSTKRRPLLAGLGALLLVGAALSPPGQALAGRIGELVGIGEETSVTEGNLRDPRLTEQQERVGPAIVTATGTILGTDIPFEIVGWAAREKAPTGPVWPAGADSEEGTLETCLGVVLPEQGRQETGKWCQGEDGSEHVPDPFHTFGIGGSNEKYFGPDAPYEFHGVVRPNVAEIVLTYTDAEGVEQEGETTLGKLDGELLAETGGTLPFGYFVSQIPFDGLERDEFGMTGSPLPESAVITAYDDAGNELGRDEVGETLAKSRLDLVRRIRPVADSGFLAAARLAACQKFEIALDSPSCETARRAAVDDPRIADLAATLEVKPDEFGASVRRPTGGPPVTVELNPPPGR